MKKLIVIALAFMGVNSIAQNTFPESGNAGVGTSTPNEALEVNGNVQVDSSITVNDSVLVQGRTRTFELVVDGDSKFKGDVVAKQQVKVVGILKAKDSLIVDGFTKIKSDLKVVNGGNLKITEGDLIVDGVSKLNGNVKMTGIGEHSETEDLQFIIQTETGQLKTVDFDDLIAAYELPAELKICVEDGDGNVPNPKWFSGLNKLYTDCDPVNVGIGTTNPEEKLDVRGTTGTTKLRVGNLDAPDDALINGFAINSEQAILELGRQVGGEDEVSLLSLTNEGELYLLTEGEKAIVVFNDAGEKAMQLESDGLLRVRKVRVDLDSWADYVFEEDYETTPLEETEEYIEENGHLPGVPSEEEIVEEGLDVGEMQKIQMEKLEELYLHMIQMNEQMKAIQEEIEALKEENALLKLNDSSK